MRTVGRATTPLCNSPHQHKENIVAQTHDSYGEPVTKLWAGQSRVLFLAGPRDVSPLQKRETTFRIHPTFYSVAAKDSGQE